MDLLTDPPPLPPSLVDRLRTALARPRVEPTSAGAGWRAGVTLALLLAVGPLATLAGARMLEDRALAEARALAATAAPRLAGEKAQAAARGILSPLLSAPVAAATLDGLARALPADAALMRAERTSDGRLAIDAVAPDPDRLRAALRRDPLTVPLRDRRQRQSEAGLVVTLEGGG